MVRVRPPSRGEIVIRRLCWLERSASAWQPPAMRTPRASWGSTCARQRCSGNWAWTLWKSQAPRAATQAERALLELEAMDCFEQNPCFEGTDRPYFTRKVKAVNRATRSQPQCVLVAAGPNANDFRRASVRYLPCPTAFGLCISACKKILNVYRRLCLATKTAVHAVLCAADQTESAVNLLRGIHVRDLTYPGYEEEVVEADPGLVRLLSAPASVSRLVVTASDEDLVVALAGLQAPLAISELVLEEDSSITDDALAAVAGLCSLVYLKLDSCWKVTGKGLNCLRALTRLERLELIACKLASDSSLSFLQDLSKLGVMSLGCSGPIAAASLRIIASLPRLLQLSLLTFREVTRDELVQICDSKSLSSLRLYCCPAIALETLEQLRRARPRVDRKPLAWGPARPRAEYIVWFLLERSSRGKRCFMPAQNLSLPEAKDTTIEAKDMVIQAQNTTLRERERVITEQEARLALADIALKQQMTVTRLQEESACTRRKLLLGAVPVLHSDDDETEAEQHPTGSTCKGNPRWSRLMNEQARVFCERLARSLTVHAKEVRRTAEAEEDEDASVDANEEAVAALQDSVAQVLRPANPRALVRFSRVDGTLTHREVVRIVCARLPSCKLNNFASGPLVLVPGGEKRLGPRRGPRNGAGTRNHARSGNPGRRLVLVYTGRAPRAGPPRNSHCLPACRETQAGPDGHTQRHRISSRPAAFRASILFANLAL
eukprot:g52514.t1